MTGEEPTASPTAPFFQDVYRAAKSRGYKVSTEEIQAAIERMKEFVNDHCEWSYDTWSLYNVDMALEALDPARWQERIERDILEEVNRKGFSRRLPVDAPVREEEPPKEKISL